MKFSIITPSFNMSSWLKLCIASVHDQDGVEIEHLIQDGGSTDGTQEWVGEDPRVDARCEKDGGMYEAINKGLRRASGDILAHLNCDEQYLPGALAAIADVFSKHPEVDVVFADVLIVDPRGELVCFQKIVRPTRWQSMVHFLPTYTCATFFRRQVVHRDNMYFREDLKTLSDTYWVLDLLEKKIPFRMHRLYTSVFTDTGANLNMQPNAQREGYDLMMQAPAWVRKVRSLIRLRHRLMKLFTGCYTHGPLHYAIFTGAQQEQRRTFKVDRPSPLWHSMLRNKSYFYADYGKTGT